MADFPAYADLKRPDATGLPLAWGVWGPDDELGTLNHITPETVVEAARLVRRGVRFNLDLPLHVPFGIIKPGMHRHRRHPTPKMYTRENPYLHGRDDKLDDFFLQASSQWDGLTHMGLPTGFYNNVPAANVTHGEGSKNGIDKVAAFGLVGRCVLADLARHFAATGRAYDPHGSDIITVDELMACLAAQGAGLQPGDILLLRTGWVANLLDAPDQATRNARIDPWQFSGMDGSEAMWKFVWDNRLAAVAADNVAVERTPRPEGETSLHMAIARLGLTLGEMFDFEALAADSAATGDYTAFFTSSPLNLRGGVGSPPNAIAVR